MSTSVSPHVSALVVAGLLFAVALLAAASNVAGRDITYDFVRYPILSNRFNDRPQETSSGQVTADGKFWVYTPGTRRKVMACRLP